MPDEWRSIKLLMLYGRRLHRKPVLTMNWNFRHRLKSDAPLIGTMLTLSTPAIAEVLAAAGFDWLFIDNEHGAMGTQEIQSVLQAVDHQLPCVVRIAAPNDVSVKKSLDVGAAGVIVPAVNTAKQAEEMVKKSLDAVVNGDPDLARLIREEDDVVDAGRQTVRKLMMEQIKQNPESVESLLRINSVSKHLERIADMATNIAEDVIYMVEGEIVRHRQDP